MKQLSTRLYLTLFDNNFLSKLFPKLHLFVHLTLVDYTVAMVKLKINSQIFIGFEIRKR